MRIDLHVYKLVNGYLNEYGLNGTLLNVAGPTIEHVDVMTTTYRWCVEGKQVF